MTKSSIPRTDPVYVKRSGAGMPKALSARQRERRRRPDSNDPDVNQPRGPKPLNIANNAPGNSLYNVATGDTSKFLLTVSNPAGPAPTASDFTLNLNSTVETANITELAAPPATTGTRCFLLIWNAKLTTGYPDRTLQHGSLRFKDAQSYILSGILDCCFLDPFATIIK